MAEELQSKQVKWKRETSSFKVAEMASTPKGQAATCQWEDKTLTMHGGNVSIDRLVPLIPEREDEVLLSFWTKSENIKFRSRSHAEWSRVEIRLGKDVGRRLIRNAAIALLEFDGPIEESVMYCAACEVVIDSIDSHDCPKGGSIFLAMPPEMEVFLKAGLWPTKQTVTVPGTDETKIGQNSPIGDQDSEEGEEYLTCVRCKTYRQLPDSDICQGCKDALEAKHTAPSENEQTVPESGQEEPGDTQPAFPWL